MIFSEDGKVQIRTRRLRQSFDFQDDYDATAISSNQYFSRLRWAGERIAFQNQTIIAAVVPLFPEFASPDANIHSEQNLVEIGDQSEATDKHVLQAKLTDAAQADAYGSGQRMDRITTEGTIQDQTIRSPMPFQSHWSVIAYSLDTVNDLSRLFIDGRLKTASTAFAAASPGDNKRTVGISSLQFPGLNVGPTAIENNWPHMRFAACWVWNRILSDQEIQDFHAMLRTGKGCAVSRQKLALYWVATRDSVIPDDRLDLPTWSAWNTKRTTIPDFSGCGRNPDLYTKRDTWGDLFDQNPVSAATNGWIKDPDLHIPEEWTDENLLVDSFGTVSAAVTETVDTIDFVRITMSRPHGLTDGDTVTVDDNGTPSVVTVERVSATAFRYHGDTAPAAPGTTTITAPNLKRTIRMKLGGVETS